MFHCTSYIVNRIPKEQGKGIIKKRQNPKTRQNRDNTHENDKKEGYQKNQQSTEGKQIHINEATQKLKHSQIFHDH